MTAAQARIGEGPLRAAEGKEPKVLQSEVTHLMNACEKLRARKRFFANKVEEITNPRATAAPPSHSPQASPAQPSDDTGAGANRPFSAAPSHTSFPINAAQSSPSPPASDQMHLVESWVVTPPITPSISRAASPVANADKDKSHDSHAVNAVGGDKDADMADADVSNDIMVSARHSPNAALMNCPGHEGGPNEQGRHSGEGRQQLYSRPSSSQGRQAGHQTSAGQQHSSRPASGQSMLSVQGSQHAQRPVRRPINLSWADGVRAPAGIALAIGPWAHTSSPALPVTTQAIRHEIIDLASPGQAGIAGLGSHDTAAADSEAGTSHMPTTDQLGNLALNEHAAGITLTEMAANDDPVDTTGAATAREAAGAAAAECAIAALTREATPDDDNSSSQMCNVCLCPIRQLIIVLQPCGHYYCENCTAGVRAVANPRCPECRTRISSTFRVPLSSSQTQTHKEDAQHAHVSL